MARRKNKRDKEAFTTEARDVLELLARLLVGGSYRVPVEGRGSKPLLQTSDVAAAMGYMGNGLQARTIHAVATRAGDVEVARLSHHAYRSVVRAVRDLRPPPLDLRKPADRWRLRIVTYDAAFELVWPERRRPYGELARDTKMRKGAYIDTHRAATSVLEQALNDGRNAFRTRLFASGVPDESWG
jgi:hypothetical protein